MYLTYRVTKLMCIVNLLFSGIISFAGSPPLNPLPIVSGLCDVPAAVCSIWN